MTRWIRGAFDHYLVLPIAAVVAIVWANTLSVSYFRFAGGLEFWVNDVAMALVLGYVAQEVIEAALPGGTLHPWRRAVVPIVAAIGGTLGAVAVYVGYIRAGDEEMLTRGWPIVCAVDLLFALAIARAVFGRSAAATFLMLMTIASDVIGLVLISRRNPIVPVHPWGAALIVPALLVSAGLRIAGTRSVWPYFLVAGPLAWLSCEAIGLHPALALLPIVPFVPHAPRDWREANDHASIHERAHHFESVFERPVQVVALLFGLVNAGVLLRGFGTGTWAVVAASLLGRPLGIVAAVGVALAAGLHLPRRMGVREVIAVAFAATPSLAFGIFVAAAVFPNGPLQVETKVGVIATAIGVVPALAAAWLLRVGRFDGSVDRTSYAQLPLTRGRA